MAGETKLFNLRYDELKREMITVSSAREKELYWSVVKAVNQMEKMILIPADAGYEYAQAVRKIKLDYPEVNLIVDFENPRKISKTDCGDIKIWFRYISRKRQAKKKLKRLEKSVETLLEELDKKQQGKYMNDLETAACIAAEVKNVLRTNTFPGWDSKVAIPMLFHYVLSVFQIENLCLNGYCNGTATMWNCIRYCDEYYHYDLVGNYIQIPSQKMEELGYIWEL